MTSASTVLLRRGLLLLLVLLVVVVVQDAVVVAAAPSTGSAAPLELTDDTVEEKLLGPRASFIMFHGSQCADCIDIRPEWNRLASDWEGHAVGQIAQVDCEGPNTQGICDYFQIQEIPTLVYGGSMDWDFYRGSLDYESLSEFAQDQISKPICSALVPENCSGVDQVLIQSLLAKSDEELLAMHDVAQMKIDEVIDAFQIKEEALLKQQRAMAKEMEGYLNEAAGEYDFKFLIAILERRLKASAYADMQPQ